MNITKLKINKEFADIQDININITYSIFNPLQPDLRGLPSTFSIKIPKTNRNLKLIMEGYTNQASLEVDSLIIISGKLIINNSDTDSFNCTILSSNVDFIKEFGNNSLKDLKGFYHLDQIFNQAIYYNRKETNYKPFTLNYELRNHFASGVIKSYGLKFDGVNDHILLANENNFDLTSDITLEVKFRITEYSNDFVTLIDKRNGSDVTNFGINYNGNTNVLQFFLNTPSTSWRILTLPLISNISLNQWNHLACTYKQEGGNVRLIAYKDGVQIGTSLFTGVSLANAVNNVPVRIGRSGNSTEFFKGYISDVRIWNIVRTQSELLANKDVKLGYVAGLIGNYKFTETSGFTLIDYSSLNNNGTLINYLPADVAIGVTNSWVDINTNPITTTTSDVLSNDFNENQILNANYKNRMKPNPLSFPVISYGNFYRLPNKEAIRTVKGIAVKKQDIANYEVRPYNQLSETVTQENMQGYIPPVKLLLLAKRQADSLLSKETIYSQVFFEGYVTGLDRTVNSGEITISAYAGDAQSWQLLTENELYEFLVVEDRFPLSTGTIKTGLIRYLGGFLFDKRAIFSITTDELAKFDLLDSLAYNDIPPVFNFYTLLEKMFSQYNISLKTDDYIYNKLSNEFLSYNGSGFTYNYKNHLGICKLDGLSHVNDSTHYFNGMRTYLSSYYSQDYRNNALVLKNLTNTEIKFNTEYTPYYEPNIVGIWDNGIDPIISNIRGKYDIFASDGSFIIQDLIHTELDIQVLYYTLPVYYETYHTKKFKEFTKSNSGLTEGVNHSKYSNISNGDIGLLENTTLSSNKFSQSTTSLVTDGDGNLDMKNYTGLTNYGYGYRCPDSGSLTFSIDFDYDVIKAASQYGYYNSSIFVNKKKPLYLVVSKIKDFENYKIIDNGLSENSFININNDTIVKYWDLVDDDTANVSIKVKEIINFNVNKGDIINIYLVFQGYKHSYPGIQTDRINNNVDGNLFTGDFSPIIKITKCDINIVFNGDYYIDVAKNTPDINQLKFFKDILVENRLLPYYNNISNTITLKQFNDVKRNSLSLNRFSTVDLDETNVFNKNINIGYAEDTENVFCSNNNFKYNQSTNEDTYTYLFDYQKTNESVFKTYDYYPYITDKTQTLLGSSSYVTNPKTNTSGDVVDQLRLFRKGTQPLDYISLYEYGYGHLYNKGIRTTTDKQIKLATISSKDNLKKIGQSVNWSFDYKAAKVRNNQHFGLKTNDYQYIDVVNTVNAGVADTTFTRVIKPFNVNELGKKEYDSYYLENFRNFAVQGSNSQFENTYRTNDSSLKVIAQRGQYRFRNGLLTNEILESINVGSTPIHINEIQPITSKDFDFINTFYRNYGYNYEKEITGVNTIGVEGILPLNDYYKIVNEGIVKVWLDNSWYYLLEITKYDVKTEKGTLKLVRKIYGD